LNRTHEIWLDCRVEPARLQDAFCSQLRAEFERRTRVRAHAGPGGQDGALGARVIVRVRGSSRAQALLSSGVLAGGQLRVSRTQDLEIDIMDASFGARAAGVLAGPLADMLGL